MVEVYIKTHCGFVAKKEITIKKFLIGPVQNWIPNFSLYVWLNLLLGFMWFLICLFTQSNTNEKETIKNEKIPIISNSDPINSQTSIKILSLKKEIKKVGSYPIAVNLHSEIIAELHVVVEKKVSK